MLGRAVYPNNPSASYTRGGLLDPGLVPSGLPISTVSCFVVQLELGSTEMSSSKKVTVTSKPEFEGQSSPAPSPGLGRA